VRHEGEIMPEGQVCFRLFRLFMNYVGFEVLTAVVVKSSVFLWESFDVG
jgi:hypothetical protein